MTGTVKTQQEAAERLGITERTLRRWARSGCPACPDAAGYDLERIRGWRDSHVSLERGGRQNGEASDSDGNGLSDRARLLRAQAGEREAKRQLAELQLAQARGQLIPYEKLSSSLLRFATAVKARSYSLIPGLAAELEGQDEKQRLVSITQHIEEFLRGLALEFKQPDRPARPRPVRVGRPRKR